MGIIMHILLVFLYVTVITAASLTVKTSGSIDEITGNSNLITGLRDVERRKVLMKNWREIVREFEMRKVELIESCESQEDIDLLVDLFHDYYLIQDMIPKIVRDIGDAGELRVRFMEGMRYLFLETPEMALKSFPVTILNELIEEDKEVGVLSQFFKNLTLLSSNKFGDNLKGIDPQKMSQLNAITIEWTEEDMRRRERFLERKARLIYLVNVLRMPLRSVGDVETVMEIVNGYGIRGESGLILTCNKCQETLLTEVLTETKTVLSSNGCLTNLKCLRRKREYNEYKHYCRNCNELLLIARD